MYVCMYDVGMYVCMYVCVCMDGWMHACMHACACHHPRADGIWKCKKHLTSAALLLMYVHMRMHAWVYISVYIHIYVYTFIYIYIKYIYMYLFIRLYTYMCAFVIQLYSHCHSISTLLFRIPTKLEFLAYISIFPFNNYTSPWFFHMFD
jgi:hypothetical protein